MNRLTHAFASALPIADLHKESTSNRQSPSDPSSPAFGHVEARSLAQSLIYDDPRSPYSSADGKSERTRSTGLLLPSNRWERPFSGASGGSGGALPKRPTLLRHATDEGTGSSVSTPRPGKVVSDRAVRVNLLTSNHGGKKGRPLTPTPGGRLTAMAQGGEGLYVVGGGQYLRILKIHTNDNSTPRSNTPDLPSGSRGTTPPRSHVLGKGAGGVMVSEIVNLWKGNWAAGKSVNDVDWGVGALDNKIVTASPNGNFMLFDAVKGKFDREVGGGHPRPMNCLKLCPIPSSGHLLLTGGTEGQARLWDLRDNQQKLKQNHKHPAPITSLCWSPIDPRHFLVGTENGAIYIYDYRYAHKPMGTRWGAHGNKAVMDLKWCVGGGDEEGYEGGGWLASGGADRTVQIWDMSQSWTSTSSPLHTLHTSHPIRKVAWRPNHPTEIVISPLASSISPNTTSTDSLSLPPDSALPDENETHLEIWDVRRHYVAKYCLSDVDSLPVDVVWSDVGIAGGEADLIACYQGGGFAQIDVRARNVPLDTLGRQVMTWSVKGEMAYAIDRFKQGEIPFDDLKPEYLGHWDKTGQKPKSVSDPPYEPVQAIGFVSLPDDDEEAVAYMAQHYRIEGDTPEDLCEWNREIAEVCGKDEDSRIWTFLQGLIQEFTPTKPGQGFKENIFDSPAVITQPPTTTPQTNFPIDTLDPLSPSLTTTRRRSSGIPLERVEFTMTATPTHAHPELALDTSSVSSHSPSQSNTTPTSKSRFFTFIPPSTSTIPSSSSRNDSITTIIGLPTGTGTTTPTPLTARNTNLNLTRSALNLPPPQQSGARKSRTSSNDMREKEKEALEDYPDPYGISPEAASSIVSSSNLNTSSTTQTKNRSSPMAKSRRNSPSLQNGNGNNNGNGPSKSGSFSFNVTNASTGMTPNISRGSGLASSGSKDKEKDIAWKRYRKARCQVLMDWWKGYIEDGEVQLATTLCIVGSCVVDFPAIQMERVAHAYIELLERYRLVLPAGYIRKYSGILSLETTSSRDGMTHPLSCTRCGKSTGSLEDVDTPKSGRKFWFCKRCQLVARECVICHAPVKGLYMGCRRCHHGGHQRCMRIYHLEADLIPPTPTPTQPPPRPSSPILPFQNSQNSSGFADRSRTSTENTREVNTNPAEDGGGEEEEVSRGWNVCPSGCGCRCRVVA